MSTCPPQESASLSGNSGNLGVSAVYGDVRSRFLRSRQQSKRLSTNTVGVARGEKFLVSKLVSALERKQRPGKKLVVTCELDCFQGVADVVTGISNGYRLFPDSARSKLGLVSFSTAKVLSALVGRKKSTTERICLTTGLSYATVRKQLALLDKLGVLRLRANRSVWMVRKIRAPFEEITAFEVKVKDWKNGIYQARNYKSFAHKSNVALPMKRARLLKVRLQHFRRMRIGLLGIGPNGNLEWFLKPRRQKPISGPRNFFAAVRLLRDDKKKVA